MATVEGRISHAPMTGEEKKVIFASSLGTVFEWYDFYLAGSLAVYISKTFFSGVNPTAGFIFTLLGFAAGFAVRPFGAIVFGRLGDMVGRKYTFLVTIVIMGLSTFVVGFLPGYASIGIVAPVIFIAMRLLQGLALGGEYGGAATYVAEHAPANKRGAWTAWIQTTATLGLFVSLLVILAVRTSIGEETFAAWGWRVPFIASIVLLGDFGVDPDATARVAGVRAHQGRGQDVEGAADRSVRQWKNLKIVLLALFGLTAGQAVVWYTGQFYSLFFLTQTLKVDGTSANIMVAVALLIGTPFFVFFGSLSDRIGRKPIIMAGCLIAALSYFPLFKALAHYTNPTLEAATAKSPIVVIANPDECSFQFNPVGTSKFTSSCDIAKSALSKSGLNYENVAAPAGTLAQIKVGETVVETYDGKAADAKAQGRGVRQDARRHAEERGLSGEGRSGADQLADGDRGADDPRDLRDDGVWADRGDAGGDVPGANPVHVDVAAVSHRQWLVRRVPAGDGVRDRRGEGEHLLGAVVSDRDRAGDVRDRDAVRQGDAATRICTRRTEGSGSAVLSVGICAGRG